MPKHRKQSPLPSPECRPSLGVSPGVLAHRKIKKEELWCPRPDPEQIVYDRWSDALNPVTIYYNDVTKAARVIKQYISPTPLRKSNSSRQFGMELYYKIESLNFTGSFEERGAIYALHMLSPQQRADGVYTASLGNWGLALSYYGQKMNVPVTVVFPSSISRSTDCVAKCQNCGATPVLCGKNLNEAKRKAFIMMQQCGHGTYISGYDHSHVIAGAGTIALEILKQLPITNVILVPIGGGALIAGIAAVVKRLRPDIKIYGIEPTQSCCFFKAITNKRPYQTNVEHTFAESLGVPIAGYNAFHTARSLIDKMVLVKDDWIVRGMLHLVEEERLISQGAGAIGLGAIMSEPNLVPELKGKNVVTIITGGNISVTSLLPGALNRAKIVEGRLFKIKIEIRNDNTEETCKIFNILATLGCSLLQWEKDCASSDLDGEILTVHEDFDEFSDPENPISITYDEIVEASHRVKPHVIRTPCIAAHSQKDFATYLYYKLEFMQQSGTFKERGALNALQLLPLDKKKLGVVIASTGNEAIAFSYHAAKLNIPMYAIFPVVTPISKLHKCHSLGAKAIMQGNNLNEAQKFARAMAREKGLTYINARDHPHVLAGYGSLALEIMEQMPYLDAVIVPVGGGGLAAATATVIKKVKPSCLVYGVGIEAMPAFFNSLENNAPTPIPYQTNLADAIAVNHVEPNSFAMAKPYLDKMLLVKDEWIALAILHLVESEKFIVEGAGAATLATIIGSLVPELKLKNVLCVLTGGNIDNIQLNRCLERGLAAEARLIKFHVGIKNCATAQSELMNLIRSGGYNIHCHFQDNSWLENDTQMTEMKLVCEAKNLEHALDLKILVEKAYPGAVQFEEPFNDRRTCPCYVKKLKEYPRSIL